MGIPLDSISSGNALSDVLSSIGQAGFGVKALQKLVKGRIVLSIQSLRSRGSIVMGDRRNSSGPRTGATNCMYGLRFTGISK
jgi:hypothetical protein